MSFFLHQKKDRFLISPGNKLRALGERPSTKTSSLSSRRRLELEVEFAADGGSAEIEKKQQEFGLRNKQKEMELEAERETMELAEMKRKKELAIKLKK